MKAFPVSLLAPTFFALVAAQQTFDPLSIIVSEAYSVFTEVNSLLSSAASAVSAAAESATASSSTVGDSSTSSAQYTGTSYASTSSDDSIFLIPPSISFAPSTSSLISSTSSPSLALPSSPSAAFGITSSSASLTSSLTSSRRSPSTTSSLTLPSPVGGTSSGLGAVAGSSTTAPSLTKSSHDSDLPIILGCVLGALALGFLVLALVICSKRRRLSSSPRHSALSPGDDEVESWRVNRPSSTGASQGSLYRDLVPTGAAPLMSEHSAFRSPQEYENPFVPVPPPPRRTAPNSRPGLTDGMVPGDDPFVKEIGKPSRSYSVSSTDSMHHTGGIAAGIAAAAAGTDLMHHYDEHQDENPPVVNAPPANIRTVRAQINRKPVPVNCTDNSQPWPYSPVSPIDDVAETAALTKIPTRSSGESGRRSSRDSARANAVFDQEDARHSDGVLGHDDHGLEAARAGLDAGLVGVAALGCRDTQDRHSSRSRSNSSNRRSRTPQAMPSERFDSGRMTTRDYSPPYRDAVPQHPYDAGPSGEQDLYGVPSTPLPPPRSRRNSALGPALPAAAVFTYANRPTVPSPLSSEIRRDPSYSPSQSRPRGLSRGAAALFSFSYDPRDDDFGAYPPFPMTSSANSHCRRGRDEMVSTEQQRTSNGPTVPDKAMASDKGYPPHLDLPLGKGSDESYNLAATTGPLGPQPQLQSQLASLLPGSGEEKNAIESPSHDSAWRRRRQQQGVHEQLRFRGEHGDGRWEESVEITRE
ncbi:uncharacterized protein Z519_03957 [Cladophialophora bantiana CBS 173.52]|uniref:Uncharacterized protein n=1 Tax=Cladophialophora bantiana (strain ATCC 10958 / CBS 173.52 / CDC B-1940 / NIH 8579) TaxID=1442370 RepID=A0A0D2HPM7_CLAB1|nr:uncharacterized protein Z519_03957 [Cladophialophora bantiana CBS 173.52]KIW95373.1 hypothetical protein Z519_03957 [Cladophialophora bantiana CBS 173.52]